MLGSEQRFPQTRGANPVEILADHRRHPPHRKRLERGQHLDPRPIADVGEDGQVGAQASGVDHERGGIDPREIELGEGARIAGSGFH